MRGVMNPFGLHFLCDGCDRNRLVAALRGAGIDCRLPTGGSFRLHEYGRPWAYQETPMADRIHREGLFLGNAPFDLRPNIERAISVMQDVCAKECAA
jgi:hypothetical protein